MLGATKPHDRTGVLRRCAHLIRHSRRASIPVSDVPAGQVPARLTGSPARAHRLQEERRAAAARTDCETRAMHRGGAGGTRGQAERRDPPASFSDSPPRVYFRVRCVVCGRYRCRAVDVGNVRCRHCGSMSQNIKAMYR